MARSIITYLVEGNTYAVPFEYLNRSHVHVLDANGNELTFGWTSDNTIQITSAISTPTVIVYRRTPDNGVLVDYQNATVLAATALNTADLQLLYLCQEALDNGDRANARLDTAEPKIVDLQSRMTSTEGVIRDTILPNIGELNATVTNTVRRVSDLEHRADDDFTRLNIYGENIAGLNVDVTKLKATIPALHADDDAINRRINDLTLSLGTVTDPTVLIKQSDDAFPMPLITKLRKWAFLGDRRSITGNGTSDDTAAVQNEINYAIQHGVKLLIPDNMECRVTDTLSAAGFFRLYGSGRHGFMENAADIGLVNHTGCGFFFDHSYIGIRVTAPTGQSFGRANLHDFSIRRPQVVPTTAAWTPTPADFDIDYVQCSGEVVGLMPICSTNFLRLRQGRGNQIFMDRNVGQIFNTGMLLENMLDVVYGGRFHNWPLWSRDTQIQKYTMANATTLLLKRVDGAKFDHVFGFADNATVRFDKSDGGGDTSLSGVANAVHIGRIDADSSRHAVVFEPGAELATAYADSIRIYQETLGTTPDNAIEIRSPNSALVVNQFISNNVRGSHALVSGAGSKLTIGHFEEGSWNGVDYLTGSNVKAPGLSGAAGTIKVGTWDQNTLNSTKFSPYPSNGGGAPRFAGKVRAKITDGFATVNTDASGLAYWPHGAGVQPHVANVVIHNGGSANVINSRNSGLDATNISRVFYDAQGNVAANATGIIVFYQTFAVG